MYCCAERTTWHAFYPGHGDVFATRSEMPVTSACHGRAADRRGITELLVSFSYQLHDDTKRNIRGDYNAEKGIISISA